MAPRRLTTRLVPLLAAALAACWGGATPGIGPDLQREVDLGQERGAAWIAEAHAPIASLSDEAVIALGYMERLRLGLGSPFRLIEYALNDPRLSDATRMEVGRVLLARTLGRQAYELDPRALDGIHVFGGSGPAYPGRQHVELIEGSVREAGDPRAGELAVRLAYSLTAAEGTIDRRAARSAAYAAALVRDREIARTDVLRLMHAAQRQAVHPLDLVPRWRSERRFLVERPPIEPLSSASERSAMELAPILAGAIRSMGQRASSPDPRAGRPARAAPLLDLASAHRLSELADSLSQPPQTPFMVALDVHRRELLESPALGARQREAGRRLMVRARNEERFAAEYALLLRGGARADVTPPRVALWAAVALRTYAQEEVWFPGFEGPTGRELMDRYGLAGIGFDPGVPAEWRPYYRGALAGALREMARVIPSLDLKGLSVHFGPPDRPGVLALHDPKTRTVYLPPETGSGTIAHEIAHDIDWQVSLKRYRVRGDYGTDRAVRSSNDRLAASMRGLTTATLLPPSPGDASPSNHASRPAEIFARSLDWFVVVSLASEGRSSGYLSSVQDDLLTGFGTVLPPDITGSAGAALVAILDEVAPLYPATRERFLKGYGPGRVLTPYDLLRRVLEGSAGMAEHPIASPDSEESPDVEQPPVALQRFAAVRDARDAALTSIDVWVCSAPGAAYDRGLEAARRALVVRVAGARARGIALERAAAIAGEPGRRWLARKLYGAPWPGMSVSPEVEEALAPLIDQVEDIEGVVPGWGARRTGFQLAASREQCVVSPLIAFE